MANTETLELPESKLSTVKQQKRIKKNLPNGDVAVLNIRWDDAGLGNKRNSFGITLDLFDRNRNNGDTWTENANGQKRWLGSGGCQHDLVTKYFPDYAHLIKWHGMMSDGPMHYLANTLYQASDKDYNGRRAGEPSNFEYGIRFNAVPVTHRVSKRFYEFLKERIGTGEFQVQAVPYEDKQGNHYKFGPKYTLIGFGGDKWHTCPFDDKTAAEEFCLALNTCKVEFVSVPTAWSEGKERELDHARSSAVWPEATDEELMQDPETLKQVLLARLPALMERFKADIEALGFTY